MDYQQVPSDETSSQWYGTASGSTAFPPGYDDVHNDSFQNYAYMSIDAIVCQSFNIDTDLPPPFGRFEKPSDQDTAPNLLLKAEHIQAVVNLRGSTKAVIEFGGGSFFRRVLEVVRGHLAFLQEARTC